MAEQAPTGQAISGQVPPGQTTSGQPKMGWVIDASVTLPWFFADEATPFTERLLDTLGGQDIWAPALWVLECTNVLQRRRRIDAQRRAEIASELSALPVRVDPEVADFVGLDRLAAAHGLSAYDAVYLELALRRSLVLVSLDARLIAAAGAIGHPVLSAMPGLSN